MMPWFLETKHHISDSKSLLEYERAIDKVRELVRENTHLSIPELLKSISLYPKTKQSTKIKRIFP